MAEKVEKLDLRDQLPRDPKRALEIVDRILAFARRRTKVQDGKVVASPLKVAVILDYAHFIAPQGDPIYVADLSQTLIQMQEWAAEPRGDERLRRDGADHREPGRPEPQLVERRPTARRSASRCRAPTRSASSSLDLAAGREAEFEKASRGDARGAGRQARGPVARHRCARWCARALTSGERITGAYLTRMKKELIEKEAAGRLEFLESRRTLDDVAGHDEAKAWLREDACC